ncbi:MAG: type II secretion system protein [Phycisphaeraceae bacterium]|nr:type II secretion system protein [Phycisphaeraceae bacterium]
MTRIRAFTLIERLVVISIIGLLVAILLPSLQQARLVAQTVTCLSSTRQYAIAEFSYAADNRHFLPTVNNNTVYPWNNDPNGFWWHALLPYSGEKLPLACPAAKDLQLAYGNVAYGMNISMLGNDILTPRWRKLDSFLKPGSTILIGDAQSGNNHYADDTYGMEFLEPYWDRAKLPHFRHNTTLRGAGLAPLMWSGVDIDGYKGDANFVMLDGHARSLPPKDALYYDLSITWPYGFIWWDCKTTSELQ